jgi:hypothetical protein
MTWRQFIIANKPMLLTLPGAAMWSLPIGLLGWNWIQHFVQTIGFTDAMFNYAVYATYVLTPVAAVCSFMAMELFSESRTNPGIAALMLVFNQITTVVASLATIGIAVELAIRFFDWILR